MDDEAVHLIRISTHTVEFFSSGPRDVRGLEWRPRVSWCSTCQLPAMGQGHRPPKIDVWRKRVFSARRGWRNGGREHWQPHGRNEQGRRQPYEARRTRASAACEVRRVSVGAATSKLVLEVLATSRRVRSPPSVDGGTAMMRGRRAGTPTQLGDTQTVAVSCHGAGCMARIASSLQCSELSSSNVVMSWGQASAPGLCWSKTTVTYLALMQHSTITRTAELMFENHTARLCMIDTGVVVRNAQSQAAVVVL